MFERFGAPAFLREARGGEEKDPKATIFRTMLVFLLAYVGGSFLQWTVLSAVSSVALFFDPNFYAMLPKETLTNEQMQLWFKEAEAYVQNFMLNSDAVLVAQIFSTVVFAGVAILVCRLIEKRRVSSMGIRRTGAGSSALLGAVMAVLLLGFSVGFAVFFHGIDFLGAAPLRPGVLCLLVFGIVLESVAEELMFRGYLMVSLSRGHSLLLGALFSSLIFTLLHATYGTFFSWVGFLNLFLFGFLLALVTIRTGNLIGAMVLHALFAIGEGVVIGTPYYGAARPATVLSFASPDRYAVIGGGVAGLSGGIAVTCALLLGIVFLLGQKTKIK